MRLALPECDRCSVETLTRLEDKYVCVVCMTDEEYDRYEEHIYSLSGRE